MKRLLLDIDQTIFKFHNFPEFGEPFEGVKEALEEIKKMGFYISLFSCRTSKEVFKYPIDRIEQCRKIEEEMRKYNLPFDEIVMDKPLANFYIGDEAIGFRGNWKKTIEELKELNKE